MNRTDPFYRIDQLLHERRIVALEVFLAELEISRATFKREEAWCAMPSMMRRPVAQRLGQSGRHSKKHRSSSSPSAA
jgi:hypothetical protein